MRLSPSALYDRLRTAIPAATEADRAALVMLAMILTDGETNYNIETVTDFAAGPWALSNKNYGPIPDDFDAQAAIAKSVLAERLGDIAASYEGPVCFYDMLCYSWYYPTTAKRLVQSGTLKVPEDNSNFQTIQSLVVDHPEIWGPDEEELPEPASTSEGEVVEVRDRSPWKSIILITLGVISAGAGIYAVSKK